MDIAGARWVGSILRSGSRILKRPLAEAPASHHPAETSGMNTVRWMLEDRHGVVVSA